MGQAKQFIERLLCSFLILCLSCGLLFTVPAIAQPVSSDPQAELLLDEAPSPRHSGFDSNSIPSEKVSQFVHACLKVVTLIERREGELQAAETESESSRIEQEIEAEALAIIEQSGLTRQEYLQLLGLANTDPEFGERVAIQLQETSS